MKTKTYTTKSGATQVMPSFSWAKSVIKAENSKGFCLSCGKTQGEVEPDARKYTCRSCKAEKVYGAEQLVVMGLVF